MKLDVFKGKHVLVLGLARSGLSGARLLDKLGAKIVVNDMKDLADNQPAKQLQSEGFQVITGSHPLELVDEDLDYVVKNPGIPYTNPLVEAADKIGVPVITEVDVAATVLQANLVAVTGTNGKTTTVSIIYDILKADVDKAGQNNRAYKVGNIGTPVSEIALETTKTDEVVIELSSFQLQAMRYLRPHIAVINNLYTAHLDYHANREEYVKAKLNISKNQGPEDYLVYYKDQVELDELVHQYSKAQLIPFSDNLELDEGCYIKNQTIYFNQEAVMKLDRVSVHGKHNWQNILAAVTVAKLKGISNDIIEEAVTAFKGVAHRSQVVERFQGRTFINDSKSTNALATQMALKAFDQPKILIVGGLDRKESFEVLADHLSKVIGVVTFGQTADKLTIFFKSMGIQNVTSVNTVAQAAQAAFQMSEENNIILFSPACASWDQYDNFEQRGEDFIQAVKEVINKEGH